jgi:hypothetical protein
MKMTKHPNMQQQFNLYPSTFKTDSMKILLLLLIISSGYSVCAQKPLYIRVYDSSGKKFYKGQVFTITDTSLQLIGKEAPLNIPVSKIGSIKTKHSPETNLFIGSVIGATTFAIIGAASAQPDEFLGFTAGEGAAAGALIGAPIGAAIGGLTLLFKNSETFIVNGDMVKWKEFQSFILDKSSKQK